MSVKIRLRRMGQKKAPFYRIVVAEIGTFDPSTDPSTFKIDEEAAKTWIANGAQPTDAVSKILKNAGIIEKNK